METDTSKRERAGKIAESSVETQDSSATDYTQHTLLGGRNGGEHTPDVQVQGTHNVESTMPLEGEETASNTLGQLVETVKKDEAASSPRVSTKVHEIDADDWIDKDLEALSATDQAREENTA